MLLSIGVFTKPHKPQKPHQNHPRNDIIAQHRTQVIVHCTAPHRMMQCGLWFYNKKTTQTTPHAPHPLYILIYLFILNIKYIINSLITLVKKKKKV